MHHPPSIARRCRAASSSQNHNLQAAASVLMAFHTAAALTTIKSGKSNTGHRTGTERRQRLAPVLTADFGIVDDVAAVLQVRWVSR